MTIREFVQTPSLSKGEIKELEADCGFASSNPTQMEAPADSLARTVCGYGIAAAHSSLRRRDCGRAVIYQVANELFRMGVAYGRRHPVARENMS